MKRAPLWKRSAGIMAVSSGLLLGGSLLSSVQAATAVCPPCGGPPLGPGGSFVLSCNVGPCGAPGPALTVDSASLDLGGFTVSCSDDTIDGIVLLGSKANLLNGTVTGCSSGVVLEGKGHHEVRNVTSTGNADIGFEELAIGPEDAETGSFSNKLVNCTASNNGPPRGVPRIRC